MTTISFNGSDERGLFAADKRPGSEPYLDSQAEARVADIAAQQPDAFGLADSITQSFDRQWVLGPHVDVSFVRADRKGRDGHAFQNPMRITLQYAAIHECTRITFVRIADHVLVVLASGLLHRTPLQTRGIARSPTAAQSALLHLVDDFMRRHRGQRGYQRFVTAGSDVIFDTLRIDDPRVLQHDLLLSREKRLCGRQRQPLDRFFIETRHDGARILRRDGLILFSAARH